MAEPLAYLITWTTYGTWLRGDARGWVEEGVYAIKPPDEEREVGDRRNLSQPPVILDADQRRLVAETIKAHCEIRGWELHAVNCRTNHVHLVVTAGSVPPETVMSQFKAWTSRRLTERVGGTPAGAKRRKWWTEHGSTRWINDPGYLANAIRYVLEGQ